MLHKPERPHFSSGPCQKPKQIESHDFSHAIVSRSIRHKKTMEHREHLISMMKELNHPCLTRRIINDISRRKAEFNDEQAKKQEEVNQLLSQGMLNLTIDHIGQQSTKLDEIRILKDELTKHKAGYALMMSELEDARSRLDEVYGALGDTLHKIDYSINNLRSFHEQHESLEDKIKVGSQHQ